MILGERKLLLLGANRGPGCSGTSHSELFHVFGFIRRRLSTKQITHRNSKGEKDSPEQFPRCPVGVAVVIATQDRGGRITHGRETTTCFCGSWGAMTMKQSTIRIIRNQRSRSDPRSVSWRRCPPSRSTARRTTGSTITTAVEAIFGCDHKSHKPHKPHKPHKLRYLIMFTLIN